MNKYLIIDTETANDIDCPFVYDIGFSVIDENGRTYESFSYVVEDIFTNEELMRSAYFAEKIPQYEADIALGLRKMLPLWQIRRVVRIVMERYNIHEVIAHNCRFDYLSTNNTQRYLTKSKYRYFFPYGTKFIDTLKMARQVFGKDERYLNFCKEHNYLTQFEKPRFTAEILYQYLTNNINFIEEHTALADTMIEKEIFAECLRRNPQVEKYLW
jgi:hypothetical protein